MERREAVAFLKELVMSNSLDISWVSILRKTEFDYCLEIKTNALEFLEEFAKSKDLLAELDREKGIALICKF